MRDKLKIFKICILTLILIEICILGYNMIQYICDISIPKYIKEEILNIHEKSPTMQLADTFETHYPVTKAGVLASKYSLGEIVKGDKLKECALEQNEIDLNKWYNKSGYQVNIITGEDKNLRIYNDIYNILDPEVAKSYAEDINDKDSSYYVDDNSVFNMRYIKNGNDVKIGYEFEEVICWDDYRQYFSYVFNANSAKNINFKLSIISLSILEILIIAYSVILIVDDNIQIKIESQRKIKM